MNVDRIDGDARRTMVRRKCFAKRVDWACTDITKNNTYSADYQLWKRTVMTVTLRIDIVCRVQTGVTHA